MIKNLKTLFAEWQNESPHDTGQTTTVERAAAVLLVEIARADGQFEKAERDAIEEHLRSSFELTDDQVDQLMASARQTSEDAISLHPHTQCLNENLSTSQKRDLLVELWRLAHADGTIDPQEEYTIRKLCGLLNLRHRDFIQAKLAAQAQG